MRLVLYLDQGTTLSQFKKNGTLARELALYRELHQAGHLISILSWAKGEDDEIAADYPEFKIFQNHTKLPNRIWMFLQLLKLKGCVVLTNQLSGSYLAALAKYFGRYKLVLRFGYLTSIHYTESLGRFALPNLKSLFNEYFTSYFANQIVTTTQAIAQQFARLRRISKKIIVLPNYIDTAVFYPNEEKTERLDFQGKIFRVVTTTRLSATQKRTDLLIKALARLHHVELVVVGAGSQRETLQHLAHSLSVPVRFLGILNNENLRALYLKSDVFCLCSEYEGHPKALIEAMACGIPVVATNVRGNKDTITQGKTGLLVDLNEKAIAHAIQCLQQSEGLHARLAAGALQGSQQYSLKNYVQRIKHILYALH